MEMDRATARDQFAKLDDAITSLLELLLYSLLDKVETQETKARL